MIKRRTVLKISSAIGATTVFSGALGGLTAFAQSTLRVRKSLHNMALDDPDLEAYRSFVAMMKAADQQKRVSWLQYSLMHGSYETGEYRYCPHGDWYFLPWHREFVRMYENAVITLTGQKNFAMPYWDWTVDRVMPKAFTDPDYKGKPNPLYVPGRTLNTKDWPLPDAWVSDDVLIKKVFTESNFQLFGTTKNPEQKNLDMGWVVKGGGVQGFLEGTPHNLIHNAIGAFMPTAGSPLDPIFMMHHCNIDRIWAAWNAFGRSNTAHMTPTDRDLWLNMNFEKNYISPTGQYYSASPSGLQDTKALGYTYPDLPKSDNLSSDPGREARLLSLLAVGSKSNNLEVLRLLPAGNKQAATLEAPLVKSLRFPGDLQNQMLSATNESARVSDATEVFAVIRDMAVGPDVASVKVFINVQSLSDIRPHDSPYFVGEIGFLAHKQGDDHHSDHHKSAPSALIELTDTVRDLAKRGLLASDNISVQLVPVLRVGAENGVGATIIPASIEIVML